MYYRNYNDSMPYAIVNCPGCKHNFKTVVATSKSRTNCENCSKILRLHWNNGNIVKVDLHNLSPNEEIGKNPEKVKNFFDRFGIEENKLYENTPKIVGWDFAPEPIDPG